MAVCSPLRSQERELTAQGGVRISDESDIVEALMQGVVHFYSRCRRLPYAHRNDKRSVVHQDRLFTGLKLRNTPTLEVLSSSLITLSLFV